MDSDNIYTYVGMIAVVAFVIYFVCKMGILQSKVVEGLTNNNSNKNVMDIITEGDVKKLKVANEKMADTLLISKYKSDYEDMIIDFEVALDTNILALLVSFSGRIDKDGYLKISNKTTPQTISAESIQLLNGLYTLKTNLNSSMEFLDGQKSSSSGIGGLFGSKSSSSSSSSKSGGDDSWFGSKSSSSSSSSKSGGDDSWFGSKSKKTSSSSSSSKKSKSWF